MKDPGRIGIKAGTVVAFDGKSHRTLKNGLLVIEKDEIVFVGKRYDDPVDEWINAADQVVTPGFVNTHTHIDSAPVTKSLLEDMGNPQFYMSRLFDELIPALKFSTRDSIATQTALSLVELLASGTTTLAVLGVGEPELISQVMDDLGVRGYVLPAIRSGSWQTEDGKVPILRKREGEGFDLLEKAVSFFEYCDKRYQGKIQAMLNPAWTASCTPELLREVRRTAQKTGMRVQIHASEAVLEFQEMLRRYGMTSIQFLESVGLLGEDLIVGHCIFISGHSATSYPGDEDLRRLSRYRVSVAHCPTVFVNRGFILESFAKYRRYGVNMSIGTDTPPQNILLEMRYACILSKVFERDPRATTAAHVFDAATLGGAKALGREDLGRIYPGAKADLLFFRTDSPRMSPVRDPIRNIVYYADPTDITGVMIGGKMVMRHGTVEGVDVSALCRKLQQHAEETWRTIPERDWAKRTADGLSIPSYPPWEE